MSLPKLTPDQRREIVAQKGIVTAAVLADRYNVSVSNIKMTWKAAADRAGGGVKFFKSSTSARTGLLLGLVSKAGPPLPINDNEPLVEGGRTLLQLEPDDCRWIIGQDHDGDLRYCACPRGGQHKLTRMYCVAHSAIAFRKGSTLERFYWESLHDPNHPRVDEIERDVATFMEAA